jgi:hypothetical protein
MSATREWTGGEGGDESEVSAAFLILPQSPPPPPPPSPPPPQGLEGGSGWWMWEWRRWASSLYLSPPPWSSFRPPHSPLSLPRSSLPSTLHSQEQPMHPQAHSLARTQLCAAHSLPYRAHPSPSVSPPLFLSSSLPLFLALLASFPLFRLVLASVRLFLSLSLFSLYIFSMSVVFSFCPSILRLRPAGRTAGGRGPDRARAHPSLYVYMMCASESVGRVRVCMCMRIRVCVCIRVLVCVCI